MNFLQLEYFLAICKAKSITRAATELFLTQSALSQQLIRLEKELNTTLFNRHGNQLTLTDAGERFYQSAQNMLFEYRNAYASIQDLNEEGGGRLSIAVTKTKSFITLSYLLPGFKQNYPNIRVKIMEVESGHVEELILDGSVDLGFCYGQRNYPIVYEQIYSEQILLAMPPECPIPSAQTVDSAPWPVIGFESFCKQPFILGNTGYLREFTLELFRQHEYPLQIAMETSNPGLAHLLVAANAGCAFIGNISTWIEPVRSHPPRYFRLEKNACQHICLGYHERRNVTKPMRAFINYAKETLNQLVY
ncbi:MAG: LysR family transcriptional regulator [Candidatus Aphodomonas sp.]|nr:LysR family transcriptional regulator [Candidatus Aphodomonas sp.]